MSAQFNNAELGAMLIAIGEQMIDLDLMFSTTFDGISDSALKTQIHDCLIHYENYDSDTANEVADRLLELSEEEFLARLHSQ